MFFSVISVDVGKGRTIAFGSATEFQSLGRELALLEYART
jgi:hypothetical protein